MTAYLTDPFIARTFDVGSDRCIRGDNSTICAYGQAGTQPWESYDSRGNLQITAAVSAPQGTFGVEGGQPSVGLRPLPLSRAEWRPSPSLVQQPRDCKSQGAPYVGAQWDYTAGRVLDSGNRWRVAGFYLLPCDEIRDLVPRLTEPLARSVPVYESTVSSWSCLTARGADGFGVHVITCARPSAYLMNVEWFTLFQDTQFNLQLVDRFRQSGPFGALSVAISAGLVSADIKSCAQLDLPRRVWKRQTPAGATQTGTRWYVQASEIPCGLANVISASVIAEAAKVNFDPKRFREPGLACVRNEADNALGVCRLTNTSIFNGRTPRIAAGFGNEETYAALTAAIASPTG